MKNNSEIISMKKNIFLILMLFLFLAVDEVQALERCNQNSSIFEGNNFYAKILSGPNFLQNTSIDGNKATYQTGYVIGGSLGYVWNYGLCLEAEYAYRRNSIKQIDFYVEGFSQKGHYQASSYMTNLLWDLPLSFRRGAFFNVKPYVGGGVGYDFQQMHALNPRIDFNQKWNHLSWQLMAGLSYEISFNTKLSLEYRFHQGGCHFYNHLIGIGILYEFNFCR